MKANETFRGATPEFWATVRLVSQAAGYSERGCGRVLAPGAGAVREAVAQCSLDPAYLDAVHGQLGCSLAEALAEYFAYRARVLNDTVEPNLMDLARAKAEFTARKASLRPSCPLPANKQRGERKGPAYFTGIINMLIEANCRGCMVDFDPRALTVFTDGRRPLRTLSRRVDGAFPSVVDPIAIWEIKEYYYTTTFGSRVADGVYETQLDGMELLDLRHHTGLTARHYLMVDDYYTWWTCGRSYLCRIIDMLNMGLVDEVFFGAEVLEGLPVAVRQWAKEAQRRGLAQPTRRARS